MCDLNTGFNWGQIGACYSSNLSLGPELSWIVILVFFVLMVLFANLRVGVWYAIASVLTLFLMITNPGNDILLVVYVVTTLLIPAFMLIPAIKKFIDRG
jgi:hypothetical protein